MLLSDDAIQNHISEYKESKKLKPENGGSNSKLSIDQSQKLIDHLRIHTYLYVKDIVAYVQSTTGIAYTIPGMHDWLKSNGFPYKKPAVVPGKANGAQKQKWIEEYNQLKQGLPEEETICFIDGVHPTHNVQPAYVWIKRGIRKKVLANRGRSRINLCGAIDILSHKILVQ